MTYGIYGTPTIPTCGKCQTAMEKLRKVGIFTTYKCPKCGAMATEKK